MHAGDFGCRASETGFRDCGGCGNRTSCSAHAKAYRGLRQTVNWCFYNKFYIVYINMGSRDHTISCEPLTPAGGVRSGPERDWRFSCFGVWARVFGA